MSSNNYKDLGEILRDRKLRKQLCRESLEYFFGIYGWHYIACQSAPFHKDFFERCQDEETKIDVIMAFRGSAKSTIVATFFPLWSVFGKQQKKFVLMLYKTKAQARMAIDNIVDELKSNKRLIKDFGPFQVDYNDLSGHSLNLKWYGAKILFVSMEQSIRGVRHGANRPDLVIVDDIEDLQAVKTEDSREKTFDWLTSEVLTIGQANTKYIIIGNLLHDDSMLRRLEKAVQNNTLDARFMRVPLLDDNNKIAWPGLYPDMQEIERKKKLIPDAVTWDREYLLKITPKADQIVDPNLIAYYNGDIGSVSNLPQYRYSLVTVDPANSKSQTADYTAILVLHVYSQGKDLRVLIDPRIINERWDFNEKIDYITSLKDKLYNEGHNPKIIVENSGTQGMIVDELNNRFKLRAEAFNNGRVSKEARLKAVAHLIEAKEVLFPIGKCFHLVNQICNFKTEKHDDLADSLSMGLSYVIKNFKRGSDSCGVLLWGASVALKHGYINKNGDVSIDYTRNNEPYGRDWMMIQEKYYKQLEDNNKKGRIDK